MALDPRIALMGRGVEVPDIVVRRGQRAQALRLEQEAADAQRAAEAQQMLGQDLAQSGGDFSKAASLAAARDYKIGTALLGAGGKYRSDTASAGASDARAGLSREQTTNAIYERGRAESLLPGQLAEQDNKVLEGQQKTGVAEETPAMRAEREFKESQTDQIITFPAFQFAYQKQNPNASLLDAQQAYARRAQAPVAGRDMALPKDVEAQQLRIRNAGASRVNVNNNINPDKMLSVADAKTLGVKFGTTVGQAAAQGINPQDSEPMSGEQAKVYAVATTVGDDINVLKEAFAKDYKGAQAGILLGTNVSLSDVASNIEDKIGRLRSGGAINDDEEARFRAQVASIRKMAFGSPAEGIASLERLQREADVVANKIRRKQPAADPMVQKFNDSKAKKLDAGTAASFIQKAGGDKDKARALAKAAGWIF